MFRHTARRTRRRPSPSTRSSTRTPRRPVASRSSPGDFSDAPPGEPRRPLKAMLRPSVPFFTGCLGDFRLSSPSPFTILMCVGRGRLTGCSPPTWRKCAMGGDSGISGGRPGEIGWRLFDEFDDECGQGKQAPPSRISTIGSTIRSRRPTSILTKSTTGPGWNSEDHSRV